MSHAATRDLPNLCHALMERSPVPMAELEGAGHVLRYVNAAFCDLVGKPHAALVARPFAESVQEGDRCLAVLDRVYRTGKPESHTESDQPSPHPAYWSYAAWPVMDGGERPIGVMMQVTETSAFHQQTGAINQALLVSSVRQHELTESAEKLNGQLQQEIAERKRAQGALRITEVRYRRLFESAKDGILVLDATTGQIIDANPFMCDLLGYEASWFLGKELWEIGLFQDKADNQGAFRDLQAKGYVRYDHLPLRTRDDKVAEVEFVSNVYEVDHREVAQCNIRDITERSRLEQQMKEQAEELADLHRRKDEFLAMLSHELRNPLAPIQNAVQLLRLQQESESPLQREARSIIERQVAQIKHLVDDLLEVSRITTGRIRLHLERVAANGIVEAALETARPLIERCGHELTVSLPPQPIWLNADAARLEQVLVNLLTNAAKYTEDGGHIWVSVEMQAKETGRPGDKETRREGDKETKGQGNKESPWVVMRVRDTGVGISPELLPHVFDLFTQAERSLDRSQGGLGIGLSLVKRIVELHGGSVDAYSSLGKGSEFVVRLPVAEAPQAATPSTMQEATPRTGSSLRVLIAEDNVDSAETLATLLRITGHEAYTAYDGPTALKAASVFRPNLLLLDIGLPGMDGYEVARRLRHEPALENVVLVALTGYGQETDRQRSRDSGFDHHLVKPTDFTELERILAAVRIQKGE